MESYFGISSFPLPFQRGLSRLYNDTKKSSDFVKEPVQHAEDPEIKALHRKLRIQKDRLVSWGLEWSDPGQSTEVLIDSSLSRAGLSEVVGSIMSTIKETLAEVEPLWQSSKRLVATTGLAGADRESDKKTAAGDIDRDRKLPIVTWDKARFADLVRDLTMSIDTLYDLSRTRSFAAKASLPWSPKQQQQTPSSLEELRPFESTRMQVPQQVNPLTLTGVEPATSSPRSGSSLLSREVVFMSKQAYADLARPLGLQHGYAPLLLEYAYFDPVFSNTGIMPSMARFEKLSVGLQTDSQRAATDDAWIGMPGLLGYFEDMENSRLGLVYHFPPTFQPVLPTADAAPASSSRSCLFSLGDLFASPGLEPKLEVKFRLAANLASTVFDMHARGIVHGRLVDSSVLFGLLPPPSGPSTMTTVADASRVDIRKPFLSSFDLFPDTPSPEANRQSRLYRHPLNPRSFSPESTPIVDADPRVYDLYSLAMLLLSIGMWSKLENLVPNAESMAVSESVLDQLAIQCGTLYMKAVQACWNAMETVITARHGADSHLARVQLKTSRYLEACCILDSVSSFEERLGRDDDVDVGALARASTAPSTTSSTPATKTPTPLSASASWKRDAMLPRLPKRPEKVVDDSIVAAAAAAIVGGTGDGKRTPTGLNLRSTGTGLSAPSGRQDTSFAATPVKAEPAARLRLYPQVVPPAEIIEKWHSYVMPQVNYALRHFYRSHPESVEISLESIGESPRSTRPTVLVVCTSVSKVRHILKKKLGPMFDGAASGFSLKVCSGRVVRSRKRGEEAGAAGAAGAPGAGHTGPKRSQGGRSALGPAGDRSRMLAANNQFQERPQNGASIGAWIGDRHLPPVSFGGLVLVDDKVYGMTVHHMLDDPDAIEAAAARESQKALRSSTSGGGMGGGAAEDADRAVEELGQSVLDWYAELQADSSAAASTNGDDDFACAFSDTNSAVSDTDATSEWSDSDGEDDGEPEPENDEEDDDVGEPGDVPGVEPGYGEGYTVTQPALDDVDEEFYPEKETEDDDHLDSCGLGDVYASSGVRRRVDERGLVHEIDWALFEFKQERCPETNVIPHLPLLDSTELPATAAAGTLHPTTVAPSTALPGLEVQCIARTSGLQTGRILPTITSVKIYGRMSPSHTYQISGGGSVGGGGHRRPIGIPGDSGAWIVEREHGRLCGHVLAWSERKRVAYLCPMDVMLLDIAETLEAGEIRLPGGEAVVKIMDAEQQRLRKEAESEALPGRQGRAMDREGERGQGRGRGQYEDEGFHGSQAEGQSPVMRSRLSMPLLGFRRGNSGGGGGGGGSTGGSTGGSNAGGGEWEGSIRMKELSRGFGKVQLGSNVETTC